MNIPALAMLIAVTGGSLGLLIAISPPHLRRATLYDAAGLWAVLTAVAALLYH